jgi:pimeloyl-ACP methyl ester carboxylesterase
MPKASVNGVELSYEVSGTGQPVLFIHGGYGGPASALVPGLPSEVASTLPAEQFQVIAYDRRNAGQSSFGDEHVTLVDLAEDAWALLDHLSAERAIIIGSSAGGPIALQFALTYPQRTLALCLPNTGADLMRPERPRAIAFRELMAQLRSEGDRATFESRKSALRQASPLIGPNASNPAAIERHAALQQALASVSDEELFRLWVGEVRNVEAYQGYDFTPRLGELTMPVCVIHGTADATVPFAWGRALHEGIPGSEFHAIEGADHGVLLYAGAKDALRAWATRIVASVPA